MPLIPTVPPRACLPLQTTSQRGTNLFLRGPSSFEGQHGENFSDILGLQAYQHDPCTSSSRDWMSPPAGSLRAWLKPTKHISTSHGPLVTAVRQPSTGFYVWGGYSWEINCYCTGQDRTLLVSSVAGDCRK